MKGCPWKGYPFLGNGMGDDGKIRDFHNSIKPFLHGLISFLKESFYYKKKYKVIPYWIAENCGSLKISTKRGCVPGTHHTHFQNETSLKDVPLCSTRNCSSYYRIFLRPNTAVLTSPGGYTPQPHVV